MQLVQELIYRDGIETGRRLADYLREREEREAKEIIIGEAEQA